MSFFSQKGYERRLGNKPAREDINWTFCWLDLAVVVGPASSLMFPGPAYHITFCSITIIVQQIRSLQNDNMHFH